MLPKSWRKKIRGFFLSRHLLNVLAENSAWPELQQNESGNSLSQAATFPLSDRPLPPFHIFSVHMLC